jgi:hypothetical protein
MYLIALWAALSMVLQDLLAVFLVQAEARNRAALSGILDCLCWPAGIICTTISVTALQGHHLGLKATVIAAVTVANFCGSMIAVKLGKRYIKEKQAPCACGCPVTKGES